MTEEKVTEEKKPERKMPPPQMVAVQVLERRGKSALVQWNEGTNAEPDIRRGYVPDKALGNGEVEDKVLAKAAPYGRDWAKVFRTITIEPAELDRAIRARGVFTLDDLARGSATMQRVLFELAGIRDVIRKAKE